MIWGRTYDSRRAGRYHWREPRSWFAWHPVRFEDGRWAWLTEVLCYDVNSGDLNTPSDWRYNLRGH